MKTSFTAARHVCRASNSFSLESALWQQFVRPYSTLPALSSASPTTTINKPAKHAAASARCSRAYASRVVPLNLVRRVEVPPLTEEHESEETSLPLEINPDLGNLVNDHDRADLARQIHERIHRLLLDTKNAHQKSQPYDGRIVPLLRPKNLIMHRAPWRVGGKHMSARERLSRQIAIFHKHAVPTKVEALVRQSVIEQVRRHVRERLPDHELEVFGSERTGLALATSDIDLRLVKPKDLAEGGSALPPPAKHRADMLRQLTALYHSTFRTNSSYLEPRLLHARYPLIALRDIESGLRLQIVLANDTSASRAAIERYLTMYPFVKSVYSVLRSTLEMRALCDVYQGGIGSYPLFMMIVASIQQSQGSSHDAASTLLNFCRYWAAFDNETDGVSIEPAKIFKKSEEPVMSDRNKAKLAAGALATTPYLLCLRDPADPTNDLGRKSFAILHVQATLRYLHDQLARAINGDAEAALIEPFVGEYAAFQRPRKKRLRTAGRKDQAQQERKTQQEHEAGAGTDRGEGGIPNDGQKRA